MLHLSIGKVATQYLSGVALANQTEVSEVRELSGNESGISSGNPLLSGFVQSYKQKGVPEPVPDSFPESSRTSLSSVWFAGTTPESCL